MIRGQLTGVELPAAHAAGMKLDYLAIDLDATVVYRAGTCTCMLSGWASRVGLSRHRADRAGCRPAPREA